MANGKWTPSREFSSVQELVNKLFEDVIRSLCRPEEGFAVRAGGAAVDMTCAAC